MVTGSKLGIQNLQEAIEIFNDRGTAAHKPCDQFKRFRWIGTVVDSHEFGQDPVEDGHHQRRVLHVWVDAISQVCSVSVVSDIVDYAQGTRDMQANRVRG